VLGLVEDYKLSVPLWQKAAGKEAILTINFYLAEYCWNIFLLSENFLLKNAKF